MDHLAQFKISDIYQENSNSFRALYKYDKSILIAEAISQLDVNEGRQYVNAELARMKGLFSTASAPYPGVISDKVVCGNNYSYIPVSLIAISGGYFPKNAFFQ